MSPACASRASSRGAQIPSLTRTASAASSLIGAPKKETSVLKTIGYVVLCVFSVGALLGVVKALVDDDDVVEETFPL